MKRGEHFLPRSIQISVICQRFCPISGFSGEGGAPSARTPVRGCVFFFYSLCGASAPGRAPGGGRSALAAGSAALRSNVGQVAAAQPTEGLAETLREPVTGTRHSCGGGGKEGREGGRDGEGLLQGEKKTVLPPSPQRRITRAGGRPGAAGPLESRALITPTVGKGGGVGRLQLMLLYPWFSTGHFKQ